MLRTKAKISLGLGIVILISIWLSIMSNPISGIAAFFILTAFLWAIAKTRRWI
jgi:hypothetical protein